MRGGGTTSDAGAVPELRLGKRRDGHILSHSRGCPSCTTVGYLRCRPSGICSSTPAMVLILEDKFTPHNARASLAAQVDDVVQERNNL